MSAILIFGDTPFAHRLDFYLREYARIKDLDTTVYRQKLDSTTTMASVQKHMWDTYVDGLGASRPQLVINAHETNDLNLCATDPQLAWRDNAVFASFIAYAARTADIPLIQMSTDHVFRGDRGPYGVGAVCNPINVYGATKWYAEMVCGTIYPNNNKLEQPGVPTRGTKIVRTSGLYGLDVKSPPRTYVRHADGEIMTAGVLRDTSLNSPSFIGEVAFLVARNILLSAGALNMPVIHVAPDIPAMSWGDYMNAAGTRILVQDKGEYYVQADVDRRGQRLGLLPTEGWHLPKDFTKSWEAFCDEYVSGSYVRFWNPDHGEAAND